MKKIVLMLILALILIALAACGAEAYEDYCYEEEDYAVEDENYAVEEDYIIEEEGHTVQHFLADLDYMLYVLENNFALFDVAYWARGVDIRAIVEDIRAEIEQNSDMDVDDFFDSLWHNFSPLTGVGHFQIIGPHYHNNMVNNPGTWHWSFFPVTSMARVIYPHVLAFYEPRHPNVENEWTMSANDLTDGLIQHRIDHAIFLGENELAEELTEAWLDGDYDAVLQLFLYISEIFSNTPNVRTNIIEEKRIAHLAIDSFMRGPTIWSREEAQILNFLEEIRDFDHLIIDIRRGGGGNPSYFYNAIMGPNIDRQMLVYGYAFLTPGTYTLEFIGPGFLPPRRLNNVSGLQVRDGQFRPIAEMLEELDLPNLNLADMERMDYGLSIRTVIGPSRLPRFDRQPAFDGKIWLLTSPYMGSAGQIIPWVVQDTGFATLVGEVTGGAYGGPRILVALPNTGILFQMDLFYVTDQHGRPLEAGTIPDYFNRPGMDALQTVLAMIEEGSYSP